MIYRVNISDWYSSYRYSDFELEADSAEQAKQRAKAILSKANPFRHNFDPARQVMKDASEWEIDTIVQVSETLVYDNRDDEAPAEGDDDRAFYTKAECKRLQAEMGDDE